MFSSGVINRQQHVGLQKVSALAGLAHSSLGPCRSYKVIQEEASGEAALAGSCVRLLESLELSCAVGQLVSEAVRTHHGAYRSGSGCLLFMAGAWGRGALECLRRGIPAPRVIHAMCEGLDICLHACRNHSIRFDPVNKPRSPSLSMDAAGHAGKPQLKGKIKLTHSRYFCDAMPDTASITPASPAQNNRDIGPAARALSHGSGRSMELVLQVSRLQSAPAAQAEACCSVFDVSKVVTCVVPGVSEEQACVLPGCVVRLPAEKVAVSQLMRGLCLRVALIAGDLCGTYRHLGSKRPPGVSHVTDRLDLGASSREAQWTERVLTSLLRLGVNLVLVSGVASESLSPHCLAHRILLVDKVRVSVLQAFAEATGAAAVTYATQLSEQCIGVGVKVTPWRDLGEHQAVNISTEANAGLVTVVLTSCVPAKLQALEDEFWACAHRVHHALQDGAVLPGAGVIELVCIHDLQKHARQHLRLPRGTEPEAGSAGGLYRDEVLRLMADALADYVATVMANSGQCSKLHAWTAVSQKVKRFNGWSGVGDKLSGVLESELGLGVVSGEAGETRVGLGVVSGEAGETRVGLGVVSGEAGETRVGLDVVSGEAGETRVGLDVVSGEAGETRVYDNLSVKLEAWRRAMDLVFLVLQTDAEVIIGIDPETLQTEPDLMLL